MGLGGFVGFVWGLGVFFNNSRKSDLLFLLDNVILYRKHGNLLLKAVLLITFLVISQLNLVVQGKQKIQRTG